MTELLVFSSDSCSPCKKLKVLLEKYNIEYTKIDIEIEPEKTVEYHIAALPTLVLVQDGEIKRKIVGLINKQALDEFLKI